MTRRLVLVVLAAATLTAGGCGGDDDSPQRANTGDTIPEPTNSIPPSTGHRD